MMSDQRPTLYVAAPVDQDSLAQIIERVRRRAHFALRLAFPPEPPDSALIFLAIFTGWHDDLWQQFSTAYVASQTRGHPFLLCYQLPPTPGTPPEMAAKLENLFTRLDDNRHKYHGESAVLDSAHEWKRRLEADLIRLAKAHRWQTPINPQLQEESRRLDVAFSPDAQSLRLQLCLPSSTGFRYNLPLYRKRAHDPHEPQGLAPLFVRGEDDLIQPVLIQVEVKGTQPSQRQCLVWPKADSEVMHFAPSTDPVKVLIKQTLVDGSLLLLGETSVSASQGEWVVASLPLPALFTSPNASPYQTIAPNTLNYIHLPGEEAADHEDDDLKP